MNKFFHPIVIAYFFAFLNSNLSAQELIVKNSYFELQDNNIIIYYDLQADPVEEYEIQLFLMRDSDKEFIYTPEFLSGDIGEEIIAGNNKKIIWNINMEFPEGLEGEDFYFEIVADEVSSSLIYYVGAAVAAAGGVVAAVLLGGGEEETPSGTTRALPPGRPE